LTVIAIADEMLRIAGIFDYNILFHNPLMSRFAIIEDVLQVVIAINSVILILFGIPVALVQRDLSRTLNEIAVTYLSRGVPLGGGWQIRNGQCVSGPLIGRELRSQAADVNQSPVQFMAAILAKAAGR
jgi:hypothetical protein